MPELGRVEGRTAVDHRCREIIATNMFAGTRRCPRQERLGDHALESDLELSCERPHLTFHDKDYLPDKAGPVMHAMPPDPRLEQTLGLWEPFGALPTGTKGKAANES